MRWALDVDSLNAPVTSKTRMIVVTNPNNPTGAVLTESEMDEIIRAARKVKAWLLVDEFTAGPRWRDRSLRLLRAYDKLLLHRVSRRPSDCRAWHWMDCRTR